MGGCKRPEPPCSLLELALTADTPPAPGLVPGDREVDEALEEIALLGLGRAPGELELLVRLEVAAFPDQPQAALERAFHRGWSVAGDGGTLRAVSTILLVGVDLFFRGKLESLLPGHHLVTTDTIAEPELVIADISRVDPEEVADGWPDIPIVGFTSHTDTAGLRRANAAGFDQVLAKSALQNRCSEVIEELLTPVE
jgi:CheY-like chemotaxis protein